MKTIVRALAVSFAVMGGGVVLAQNYPAKPVRVVVPWPPGGANDIVGRIVAQRLGDQTGQQFVIDNRGGANGTIGADQVAKAPADGYTVMVHSAAHVTSPHLYKKLPYDTLKDFTGVTSLAVQVGMLVIHPSLPVKSVKEFIALGRAQHVPFKGGGPAVVALASGEIQAMTATIGSVIPHLPSGRLRAIGVTSATRMKQFPDVPAIAEGLPGYDFVAWIGAFVASGTPKPIVDRLNAEMKKALENPDVVKIMSGQTLDPMHMSSEQFQARLKVDYDKYEKLVKLTGATAN
jgi:tripartite-type tricarboxylate transporter receptor subunit TctC